MGAPIVSGDGGRLYLPYLLKPGSGRNRHVGLLVRDAATLDVVGGIRVPELANLFDINASNTQRGPALAAVDRVGGRVFVKVDKPDLRLLVLDDSTLTHRIVPIAFGASNPTGSPMAGVRDPILGINQHGVTGMTYVPSTDRLLIVQGGGDPMFLTQVDPTTGAVDWSRRIRSCRGALYVVPSIASGSVDPLVTSDSIFVPCSSGSAPVVVRLPRAEAPLVHGAEEAYVGLGVPHGYLTDAPGRRLHVKVESAGTGELSIVTFDATKRAWVGFQSVSTSVTDNPSLGLAVDEATGRVFAQASSAQFGLTLLDGRGSPVPPGRRHRELASPAADRWPTLARDSVRGRLYLPDVNTGAAQTVLVIEDDPPETPPLPDDPDLLTVDVPEAEGTTGASYTGGTSAYGSRQLLVGGLRGLIPNGLVATVVGNDARFAPCYTVDREIVLARVRGANLSTSFQDAVATPAEADPTTRLDALNPSRCQEPASSARGDALLTQEPAKPTYDSIGALIAPYVADERNRLDNAAGQEWPFSTAVCVPGEPPSTGDSDRAGFEGWQARADCESSDLAAASADSRPLTATGPAALPAVTIGHASASTVTRRDAVLGMVTTVQATARGIDIGGVVQIDQVDATAETHAAGRPGTAGTTYSRKITGLRAPGFECDVCNESAQLASVLTTALQGRGEVRLPALEASAAAGSPGGYQSGVERDRFEALNAQLVNGDNFTEVPALEVIFYNDSPEFGRSRQIFQFAGIKANSQYGIFCLQGRPDEGGCPRPDPASLSIQLVDDADEKPLPGGTFQLHQDNDGDSVLGLADTLLTPGGTCVTNEDGACTFGAPLPPGDYVITQKVAPLGYARAPDAPLPDVAAGVPYLAKFRNVRSVGMVTVTLSDDSVEARPLRGGRFELYADDGNELLGALDKVVATCATAADGSCPLLSAGDDAAVVDLPLDAYLVHQTAAPPGYRAADDVPFALRAPGESVTVTFVNGLEGTAGTAGASDGGVPEIAAETDSEETVQELPAADVIEQAAALVEVTVEEAPPLPRAVIESQPIARATAAPTPLFDSVGRSVGRVVAAPVELAKFLLRDPNDGVLLIGAAALVLAPLWCIGRRRRLDWLMLERTPQEGP